MRLENVENAYEKLKDFTRGKNLNKEQYIEFVENLDITQNNKDYLKSLNPRTYIGVAPKLK